MKTFLFYDIETSGLNPCFDQILTFAAIRTDPHLNEISRENIIIKLRPDIAPSPEALITNRLSLQKLSVGVCEYEASKKLHKIVNTPDTISIGYNSLNFDDEFLRFTFYRNLLSPYTHQYANGCHRMDILPIAILYRLFRPKVLKWPTRDGKPSMKLELISKKNSLVPSGLKAHDAMVDVEATLALAKHLYGEKEMWNYCLGFFDKKLDKTRTENIDKKIQCGSNHYQICIMVSLSFGSKLMYMAPVIHIGQSNHYTNQNLWLRLDNENFTLEPPNQYNCNDKQNNTFVIRKRYGESEIILPPEQRFWDRLSKKQIDICSNNLKLIQTKPHLFEELVQYHKNYKYPHIPDLDIDASLYQSDFFSWQEKKEIAVFHNADLNQKAELTLSRNSIIKSDRIKTIGFRILFRNYPDYQPPWMDIPLYKTEEALEYMKKIKSSDSGNVVKGFRNDTKMTYNTGAKAIHRIKQAGRRYDEEQLAIIDWLEKLYGK